MPDGVDGAWERNVLARTSAGDDDALAELYERYAPLVRSVAGRLVSDRFDLDEIVQDVFVFVWINAERFDPERASARAWLLVITRRRAIDRFRRDAARRSREKQAGAIAARKAPDPADLAEDRAQADRVRAAVARLPPEQRRPIEVAFASGLSYREVATRLGLAEGTAKSRIRLALARLAHGLDDLQP